MNRQKSAAHARVTLLDADPATVAVRDIMGGVVVIVTGPNGGERSSRSALARREKSDDIDFRALAMLGIRSPLDIVRLIVVVDEGDAAALRDGDLPRIHAHGGNRNFQRRRRRRRWRGRGCGSGS